MIKKQVIMFSLFFFALTGLASEGTDGVRIQLKSEDLNVVQAGEKIYLANCASCHGVNLEGQPDWRIRDENGLLPAPPHDASGHTWHHADDLLFELTKYGPAVVIRDESYKSAMPAFKGILNDDEIIAALSYIKNSWPKEEREWQDKVNSPDTTPFAGAQSGKSKILDKLLNK